MDQSHKKALIADINQHLKHNRSLFPLRKGRKEPLVRDWPKKRYSKDRLIKYVKQGYNLAWKLGPDDLVIDIDPRHYGCLESLQRLTEEWMDLEWAPKVNTGGADQGIHYYLKLPGKVKIKSTLKKYPGIDFRHIGQYVVIANSLHPSGNYYQWDKYTTPDTPPIIIPNNLFEDLKHGNPRETTPKPKNSPDIISPETLRTYLNQLEVTEYQDYHDWLKIAMSAHSGTAGEGLDVFLDWSLSDPEYEGDEDTIREKWATFSDRNHGISIATIAKAVIESGGKPIRATAEMDFADAPVPNEAPLPPKPKAEQWETLNDLIDHIEIAPPDIDWEPFVRYGIKHGPMTWEKIRRVMKQSLGLKYGAIDLLYNEIRSRKKRKEKRKKDANKPDYGILVANRVLSDNFNDGEHLLHARNQQFYFYTGTHWELLPPNVVDKFCFEAAEELALGPDTDFKPSLVIPSAERVLVAKSAHVNDVLRLGSEPPACINCLNAEVWLNKEQGEPSVKSHTPNSYLLNCLDTTYDPDADCILFDSTLLEIFRDNEEPEEMVRHFLEFVGYLIQPHKNIPSWWIFHGRGSNGKTILMEIVQSLLGDAVLPRPVADFADTSRNNHATANLVGKLLVLDDDADVNAFLPESALKKLAESKLLEANPKAKDAFTFRSTATPVVLINDWPRVKDLSWGMLRKAFVMPFKRSFDKLEMDLSRKDKIINGELSGVLNRALEGYRRLRKRGGFKEPQDCVDAKIEWLRFANPLVEFARSQLNKAGNGHYLKVVEAYEQYKLWCHNQGGVRSPLMQNRFEISMLQMGYKTGYVDDILVFLGLEMRA
jgi:P4 family phage/plasmid primase-like protien